MLVGTGLHGLGWCLDGSGGSKMLSALAGLGVYEGHLACL